MHKLYAHTFNTAFYDRLTAHAAELDRQTSLTKLASAFPTSMLARQKFAFALSGDAMLEKSAAGFMSALGRGVGRLGRGAVNLPGQMGRGIGAAGRGAINAMDNIGGSQGAWDAAMAQGARARQQMAHSFRTGMNQGFHPGRVPPNAAGMREAVGPNRAQVVSGMLGRHVPPNAAGMREAIRPPAGGGGTPTGGGAAGGGAAGGGNMAMVPYQQPGLPQRFAGGAGGGSSIIDVAGSPAGGAGWRSRIGDHLNRMGPFGQWVDRNFNAVASGVGTGAAVQGANSYGDYKRREAIRNMGFGDRLGAALGLMFNPGAIADRF